MGQADDAIAFAHDQIGKPYKFGAVGPDSYDCSGLIVAAYKHAKPPINLPHFTGALIFEGDEVTRSNLKPGDLVFPDAGHVQLYVGDNQMIEAPQAGQNVRLGPLWGFWRARRITGTPGRPLSSTVAATVDALFPFDEPLEAVGAALRPYAVIGTNLANPVFWRRAAMFFVGMGLLVAGTVFLFRRPIAQTGSSIVGGVGQLASFVVGGAAIGGAESVVKNRLDRVGQPRISAAPSTSPVRVPRAPAPARRGVAPVSSTPVTAPVSPMTAPQSPGGTYTVTKVRATAKAPTRKLPNPGGPNAKGPKFLR
jgi:hypothetical protein